MTEFTPGGAAPTVAVDPNGTTVTTPPFCAGQCYDPISVKIPKVTTAPGSGHVATVTYRGSTYEIVVGELPPVDPPPVEPPPVDPPPVEPPPGPSCPGDEQSLPENPVVCFSQGSDWEGNTIWYVGTCAPECRTVRIPIAQLVEVPDTLLCRVYPKSC